MSDNEVERFEVTDYDLQNEFNVNRPRRRLTKNQQIYGIWADDSGDEEQETSRRRPQFQGTSKKKQSYATPVSFVAGGVQQAGKKDEAKAEKKDASETPMQEDEGFSVGSSSEEEMPRSGFGQLRSQKSKFAKRRPLSQPHELGEIDSDIAGMRRRMPGTSSLSMMQKGVGNWERHTKGIGAKLLLQMGFQPGKGLGRNLQGIAAPVEATVRKGRGAIGAYGPEKGQKVAGQVDSEDEEAKEFSEKLSQWRKGESSVNQKKPKIRYVYKTVDQVLEEGKSKPTPSIKDYSNLSKVKVIDMTGPEQRILSGYHAIAGQQRPSEEWDSRKDRDFTYFDLPELLHNLDLLVTMCEQDIVDCGRKLRYGQDRSVVLEQEIETLGNLIENQASQTDDMDSCITLIDTLNEKPLSLEKAAQCVQELRCYKTCTFRIRELLATDGVVHQSSTPPSVPNKTLILKRCTFFSIETSKKVYIFVDSLARYFRHHYFASMDKHTAEYRMYEMDVVAANLVTPIVRDLLGDWHPLETPAPSNFIGELQRWRQLLEGERAHTLSSAAAKDPYHSLVWEAWMPSVRNAVNAWNCRQSGPMITLLEVWRTVIPSWVLISVVEQLILPKLNCEVDAWDPLTDTVPVHEWLHPWIPYAKDTLAHSVYPIIRRKLASALTAWHPSDRSAHLMLKPWQNAFPRGDMDAFLVINVLPKLQVTMQELVINPHQQHLDQWNWVMEWEDMLPMYTMASLLEKFFFPKWIQVLTMWLSHAPNYDEIGNWYRGWKNMLSEPLRAQPGIKSKLHEALQLMNRAAVSVNQNNQNINFLTAPPPPPPPPRRDSPHELMAEAVRTASQIPQGFRELLQKRCEERGIIFVPIPNRWQEAKQVYRCGRVQIYLDRNVIFVCRPNTDMWTPSNLQAVLEMAG